MNEIVNATNDSFEADVLKADTPVLVDFWAISCPPCKAIAPVLEELAVEYKDKVKVVKVDVAKNDDLATQYAIRNIPSLFIFKNGEVVDKVVGALPRSQLAAFMDKHA